MEADEDRWVRGGRVVAVTEEREELRLRGRKMEDVDDEDEGGEDEDE